MNNIQKKEKKRKEKESDPWDLGRYKQFRWGVALVGEFLSWALLSPLWDSPFRYRGCTGRRRSDEAVIMKEADV